LESPSPDLYQIKLENNKGIKFTTSKRKEMSNNNDCLKKSPGPGAYSIPTTFANLPLYERSRKEGSQFI
jgi:hypothetical protein